MVFGKQINRYYLKYAPWLILGLLALIAVDVFQMEIPKIYRMVINGIHDGYVIADGFYYVFDAQFLLEKVCIPIFVIIVVLMSGRFLWRICFFGTGFKVERDLRSRLFDHCKDLSLQFYQKNKVGNLMSLYTNDLETLQDCFGGGSMEFFDAVFLGSLAIYNMARMNPVLMALSLIPMACMLTMSFVIGKYLTVKWNTRQEAFSDLSDFSQESFSGIAVIKAFVKEYKELLAFNRLNSQNENANVAYTRLSALLNVLNTLFIESVTCVILGYGGYLVYTGVFNAGQLMEFIGYFNALVWPFMAIAELIEMASKGKASLKRVSDLLETPVDVKDSENVAETENGIRGEIEFRHLTFTYPGGDYEALHDVSFRIEAGENVGIIGKTGSGKTTVADLLLRTYNVPDGTLFVDGRDVNTIPIKFLRNYEAYVPQDNFLFSDTIENNIGFAFDNVNGAAAEEAARMSDVHDNIVEFHNGYQTVLGERGVTVSGGQKQRISIARAIMKDSSILILDDSVSAVDTDTEKVILGNLARTRKGKTTILIAHRISTVRNMDKIVFLDEGRVEAVGTHEQLEASCPEYRKMVDLQRLEDQHREVNG